MNMKNCIFCKIAQHELPSHIVYEDDRVIVFMSLENHPMVVPKKHFTDVYELDDEYASAIMQTAVRVASATKKATSCDGINLSQANGKVAGQDVFHFHLHIKPRFESDGIVLNWNTETVADEKRAERGNQIKQAMN
jgi:histidine triad (HIT) family protein